MTPVVHNFARRVAGEFETTSSCLQVKHVLECRLHHVDHTFICLQNAHILQTCLSNDVKYAKSAVCATNVLLAPASISWEKHLHRLLAIALQGHFRLFNQFERDLCND